MKNSDLVTINPLRLRQLSSEAATAGDIATHNYCEMLLAPTHWHPEQIKAANANIWAVLEEAEARASDHEEHGYTFAGWLQAAGREDSASEYDLRAAWRAGEDPTEYRE